MVASRLIWLNTQWVNTFDKTNTFLLLSSSHTRVDRRFASFVVTRLKHRFITTFEMRPRRKDFLKVNRFFLKQCLM